MTSKYNRDKQIINKENRQRNIKRCRDKKIILPTFAQQRNPAQIPPEILDMLSGIDLQDLHPLNLFRINWRNDPDSSIPSDINFMEIPKEITGVPARIIGLVGKFFPTGAHKVGATYGCLVPAMVTGEFNPEYHKAVWPSTGNYCRGGVFNSALLDVPAVAILPEEMSRERFDWLRNLGAEVHATPGCESNVKEIYDKCHELEAESDEYMVFNQFDQFGNAVWHYEITGPTIEEVFNLVSEPGQQLTGYVSATGSAGTIAAGDYLREKFTRLKVLACEALQCPTLLLNGFGGHRIEGIGDKHIPWIHNTKNLDAICAIDDQEPMDLLRLFNEPDGHQFLKQIGVDDTIIKKLPWLGISSIANLLGAIKMAKYYESTANDVIFTIFTDSSDLYKSRLQEMNIEHGPYSKMRAEIDWAKSMAGQRMDYFKELNYYDRKAIHNLKYFTWVEQQGKNVDELNEQWYDPEYWQRKFNMASQWDHLIEEFNQEVGPVR